jgi:hypothetical protein
MLSLANKKPQSLAQVGKQWPLESVQVQLVHSKIDAHGWDGCGRKEASGERIVRCKSSIGRLIGHRELTKH